MRLTFLLPAAATLAGAAAIFTRAGYGPFGDRSRRGKPCTASRCVHNASILALIGALLLKRGLQCPEDRETNGHEPEQATAPARASVPVAQVA
jgi:hypothetical protein